MKSNPLISLIKPLIVEILNEVHFNEIDSTNRASIYTHLKNKLGSQIEDVTSDLIDNGVNPMTITNLMSRLVEESIKNHHKQTADF